jgi:hypothetical protein
MKSDLSYLVTLENICVTYNPGLTIVILTNPQHILTDSRDVALDFGNYGADFGNLAKVIGGGSGRGSLAAEPVVLRVGLMGIIRNFRLSLCG